MSNKKFKSNTLYRIKDQGTVDDYNSEVKGNRNYNLVLSEDYAEGCYVADCWIIDQYHNVHPGYKNSPTPFNIDDLEEIKDGSLDH